MLTVYRRFVCSINVEVSKFLIIQNDYVITLRLFQAEDEDDENSKSIRMKKFRTIGLLDVKPGYNSNMFASKLTGNWNRKGMMAHRRGQTRSQRISHTVWVLIKRVVNKIWWVLKVNASLSVSRRIHIHKHAEKYVFDRWVPKLCGEFFLDLKTC